jgi:hypothetical protein
MWTMWLRANPDAGSSGELANLRLAKRTAKAVYPILDDPNASKLPAHPARQDPPKPDSPRDLAPLAGPVTLEYRSATPLSFSGPAPAPGLVVAYDAKRVLLIAGDTSYKWYDYRSEKPGMGRQEVFAVQTLDGGTTWTGLDGDKDRSWQHVAVRPVARVVDDAAGAVLWNKDGCGNNPGPRHRLIKFSFTGKAGWTFNRKDHVFNEENYHCGVSLDDAVRTKGGRIWAAFAIAHRLFDPGLGLHAKYSDSDGVAWHTWQEGRLALVPGGNGGGQPLVVPYGDHVGVLFMKDAGNTDLHYYWTWFDGKQWSPPQVVHGKYVHSAVAIGEKDVLVSHGHYWGKRTDIPAGGKAGVKRFDGTKWIRELDGMDAGELCVTGRSVAAVSTYGENVLVRWRSPEGKWDERPQTIPTGGQIGEWRACRFSPPNLVAAACIPKADPKTIKVLLLPNPHFKAP